MIGVVVPAHNEEALVGPCVRSIMRAACHAGLHGEEVTVIVVLDDCTDKTGAIACASGAVTLESAARNVGRARALGATAAIDRGVRWLAFTDCDSVVAPDWLAAQIDLGGKGADAVCGTVSVDDWAGYGEKMRLHFSATYFDVDGHSHVHGANLGMTAAAYQQAGGFQPLETSEDVELVESLKRTGAQIVWSAMPRVSTSARLDFRAPSGFGATLERVEQERLWVLPMAA